MTSLAVSNFTVPLSPNTGPQPPVRLLWANQYRESLLLTTPNTATDCEFLVFGSTASQAQQNGFRLFTKQVVPVELDYNGELWLYVTSAPFGGDFPDHTYAILHVIETIQSPSTLPAKR